MGLGLINKATMPSAAQCRICCSYHIKDRPIPKSDLTVILTKVARLFQNVAAYDFAPYERPMLKNFHYFFFCDFCTLAGKGCAYEGLVPRNENTLQN